MTHAWRSLVLDVRAALEAVAVPEDAHALNTSLLFRWPQHCTTREPLDPRMRQAG